MATRKQDAQRAFVKLARDRFKLAEDADSKQREREIEDLRFYAGEQWDSDLLKSRQGQTIGAGSGTQVVPARPSLTINRTREPVRQVLNAERQADLGIELIPADDWGETRGPIDHSEIELREGLVRRIQRDSEASDARTWAFARSAIAGRGYWLVMTRFIPGKTWDQEVYIERLYNQSSVWLDPSHEQPDGSDALWGGYGVDMLWDDYVGQYGETRAAQVQSDEEWRQLGEEAPGWFDGEGETRSVRVMNYYYTQHETQELALLEDGTVSWADEVPEGAAVKETRHVQQKSIKWAKINGCEVIEETDWPGHWIPIIKVVGEELQPFDKERRCEGIVRPMRDPCKGNNYIVSKFVERVGLTPIPPIMMAAGQDEGYEAEYDSLNTRTLSRVHYNQRDTDQQPAPPPFRIDARSEIADIAMGVQVFSQAIQSTSVTPETALGYSQDQVKSGRLAKLLIDQSTLGTSNFLDNLVRSMRHEARVVNDLLYPIYGRPGRLARMMNPKGEMSSAIIGQPFVMQGEGPQARPVPVDPQQQPPQPQAKTYTLTKDADFNVAVKVSKKTETRRQEIAEALSNLVNASPEQMGIMGDMLWKYIDMPEHDELERRYKAVLVPPVQALLSGDQPIPPQVQQQLQQAGQMIEGLTKELQARTQAMEADQVKQQGQLTIEQLKQAEETKRAELEAQSKYQIEKLKVVADLLKTRATLEAAQTEAMIDREIATVDAQVAQAGDLVARQDAATEADRQRAHEAALATVNPPTETV